MTIRGQVEPQQKVFADPPISVGGGLYDIHPMRRGGVKSFVDDLVLGRGVVPSRAATSLRSVETQPLTRRFVRNRRATSPYPRSQASLLICSAFCFVSLSQTLVWGEWRSPSAAAWGCIVQTGGQQFERCSSTHPKTES